MAAMSTASARGKKILNDPKYHFHNRTPVDLKDRFRTIHPQEYKRLYPDAHRVSSRNQNEAQLEPFGRIQRKQRRPFTKQEDEQLWLGVKKHGVAWSKIAKDEDFEFSHRRSTDLRDRYRNAFPDEYKALGYSAPPTKKKKLSGNPPRNSPSELDNVSLMSEDNVDRGPELEAMVLGGADENEQQTFWEEPSTSTSKQYSKNPKGEGYETSVPISRHEATHVDPIVATPVFMESNFGNFTFDPRSPSSRQAPTSYADHLMVTPKVTRVIGARVKAGQIQYKLKFSPSWTGRNGIPPGSVPSLNEFVNVLNENVSPIQMLRTV